MLKMAAPQSILLCPSESFASSDSTFQKNCSFHQKEVMVEMNPLKHQYHHLLSG